MSAQKGKRTKSSSDSSPDRSNESTAPKKAKEDAIPAIEEKDNSIMFDHQIQVKVARITDLPAELIKKIDHYLPFSDKKSFRQVCLGCPDLRLLYNDKILESGILKVDLKDRMVKGEIDKYLCVKFVNDLNMFVNSNLKLDLTLPGEFQLIEVDNLGAKVIELVEEGKDRIENIEISSQFGGELVDNLLEVVLPKLTELKKIKIIRGLYKAQELLLQLIKNNSGSVEKMELHDMRFTSSPVHLTDLKLNSCHGKIVSSLSKASNLKKLKLSGFVIDAATAVTFRNLKKLEELEINACQGDITTVMTEAAPNISVLKLEGVRVPYSVEVPFTKLKKLKLWTCFGDVSSVLTQAAPYITTLDLGYLDQNTMVHNPFTNLQVLVIRRDYYYAEDVAWLCKEMDIQDCPLLTRGGTLSEFGSKSKRTWNEDEDGNEID